MNGFTYGPDRSPRNEYNAILYLQPATDANKKAIGYDMGTEDRSPSGNGCSARFRQTQRHPDVSY